MGRGLAAGAWVLAALITLGAGGCTGSHAIPPGAPASAAPAQAPVRAVAPAGVPRCTIASASAPSLGRSRISMAGKPALAGLLPAGQFPREMAPEPGGRTLLVTNFDSGQVELVNVAGLP